MKWPSESDDQTKDLQGLPLHIIIKFPTCYCRVLQLPPKSEGPSLRVVLKDTHCKNCKTALSPGEPGMPSNLLAPRGLVGTKGPWFATRVLSGS